MNVLVVLAEGGNVKVGPQPDVKVKVQCKLHSQQIKKKKPRTIEAKNSSKWWCLRAHNNCSCMKIEDKQIISAFQQIYNNEWSGDDDDDGDVQDGWGLSYNIFYYFYASRAHAY